MIPDEKVKENSRSLPEKTAETRRRELIELDMISEAYVDSLNDGLESILKLKPDIFAFGHDQQTRWEERLQKYLSSNGLNPEYVCLGVYNNGIHSSEI